MELARALSTRSSVELHLSLSRQSELFAQTDAGGVPAMHVDTYRSLPGFLAGSLRLPLLSARLRDYIRRNRIDVVYNTMDFLWGSALAPVIRKTDARYLLAVHDAQRHPGEDGRLRRWLLERDIGMADGAVALTETVREQLIKTHSFPRERAWTAPLGMFLEGATGKARYLPSDRPVRLLFFGRILPYKGLDMVLEALPLIRAVNPNVELEIWGNGDIAPYREALADAEGVRLEHRWLEECEIAGVFDRTDICVLPYREASQSAVVASALSVGMPVVTTPLPSLIEQIGGTRTGRISSDFSPQSLARTILDLVASPTDYHSLSQGALAFSQEALSWDSIGDKIEDAMRQLRSMPPRHAA